MNTLQTFVSNALTTEKNTPQYFDIDILSNTKDMYEWEKNIRFLESKGFSIGVVTKKFPEGVYIAEGLNTERKLQGWNLDAEIPEKIIVKNIGWPLKSMKPEEPKTAMGLKIVPHYTMAVLFGDSEGWGKKVEIIPYSFLTMSVGDTTGIQYGQSAFEGACAMKDVNDDVYGFRLDKNAQRMDKSIQALNMPSLDPDLIQKSIEEIVRYNTEYIPNAGEGQLYIRPSFCGLSGGLGIINPDHYVFSIEIAAMGSYFAPTIAVEGRKDIHRPYTGVNKISPNYGASFKIKKGVKERGYTDYLSFTNTGMVEEVATCAVGFIDTKGAFVFPPVQDEIDTVERNILPSITRYSTIEVLQLTGATVEIRDVHADEISEMNGMFTMGNAVGILHVERLCLKENEADKGTLISFEEESKNTIFDIKEKIFAARIGQLEGFEDWAILIK